MLRNHPLVRTIAIALVVGAYLLAFMYWQGDSMSYENVVALNEELKAAAEQETPPKSTLNLGKWFILYMLLRILWSRQSPSARRRQNSPPDAAHLV